MRLELSNGGWVEISDSRVVTERLRRPVREAMQSFSKSLRTFFETHNDAEAPNYLADMQDAITTDDTRAMTFNNDFIACALVDTASFLAPGQKCTPDDFLDLPGADYDLILTKVAPSVGSFMNGVDFSVNPDPASPSQPSNA